MAVEVRRCLASSLAPGHRRETARPGGTGRGEPVLFARRASALAKEGYRAWSRSARPSCSGSTPEQIRDQADGLAPAELRELAACLAEDPDLTISVITYADGRRELEVLHTGSPHRTENTIDRRKFTRQPRGAQARNTVHHHPGRPRGRHRAGPQHPAPRRGIVTGAGPGRPRCNTTPRALRSCSRRRLRPCMGEQKDMLWSRFHGLPPGLRYLPLDDWPPRPAPMLTQPWQAGVTGWIVVFGAVIAEIAGGAMANQMSAALAGCQLATYFPK